MHPFDVITEAVSALVARPSRAAFTILGTVLGVGTLVVILCLTATIQGQVSARFNVFVATTVLVHDARADSQNQDFPFSRPAEERVRHLNGVENLATSWNVNVNGESVAARPAPDAVAEPLTVVAATPGIWSITKARVALGRTFDDFDESASAKVVVLGASAAHQLGITSLATQPVIFIGDEPYTVMGIIDAVSQQSNLLLSVIIPTTTASDRWGPPAENDGGTLTITTALGAAQQVAKEAPLAVSPTDVSLVTAVPPPDPQSLRQAVNGDLSGLFLVLAVICLIIGAVGIANTTLVAVLERTGEIGLRRSLGARRKHIGAQIVMESAILGVLGGLIGSSLGVLIVLVVSLVEHWAPVVDPSVIIAAPAVGLLTGVVAGLYPSWRATRIEPTEALRR